MLIIHHVGLANSYVDVNKSYVDDISPFQLMIDNDDNENCMVTPW